MLRTINNVPIPGPDASVEAHERFLKEVSYRQIQELRSVPRSEKRPAFQAIGRAKQRVPKERLKALGRFQID